LFIGLSVMDGKYLQLSNYLLGGNMATYKMIQQYVKEKYNQNIRTCWIAHVKEIEGLKPSKAPNRISGKERQNPCPKEYMKLIKEALKHFHMI